MYSKLIIIGNLGGDPEIRYLPSGDPVAQFSVATSRKTKTETETTWYKVSLFGKQAELVAKYLHKGSKVLVEGRLRPDTNGCPRVYQRKDGTWASGFEVTAETVRFLDSRTDSEPADDDIVF